MYQRIVVGDGRFLEQLENREEQFLFFPTCPLETVGTSLERHGDIQIFELTKNQIIIPKNVESHYAKLKKWGMQLIIGEEIPKMPYPNDCPYNGVRIGTYIFSHPKREKQIENYAIQNNLTVISVKQGYTKCNVLAFGNRFITSDRGLSSSFEKMGLEGLLISPGHVNLDGYSYGFIGGASGVWEREVYFTGSLRFHPEGEKIRNYIQESGFSVVELRDEPLIDIGSLFFLWGKIPPIKISSMM